MEEKVNLYNKRKGWDAQFWSKYGSPTKAITRKNFKYWDMYVWANSVDSDQTALKEQSDQDLQCLPFFLHLLEALLHCKNLFI